METFLDTLWEEIVTAMVIAGVLALLGIIYNHLKKRNENLDFIKKEITTLRKRQWRVAKAVIIFAKLEDEKTEKHHDTSSELEEVVREIIELDTD